MEAKEGTGIGSSGVPTITSDAPAEYCVMPRTDNNPNQPGGSPVPSEASPPEPVPEALRYTGFTCFPIKKKRGRPRKYAPDGSLLPDYPLCPTPISSSAPPLVIDFSVGRKSNVRPMGSSTDDQGIFCSVGSSFTPHIVTVIAGEDITSKIISFSQQGSRAICILSANGIISTVSLRLPEAFGGTSTYKGPYEILSLTGSFTPTESEGIKNSCGGMSVTLVSQDGRVLGGGVAGLLEAASPIQIVVGSFLTGNQNEVNLKKPKLSTADD